MEFTQPSDEIITDKTQAEQKRLIEIRNQVTLLEGETVRLRDLIQAEKYEIGELVKQKAELTEKIPKLQSQCDSVGDDIASLTANLVTLEERRDGIVSEIEESHKIQEELKTNIVEMKMGIDYDYSVLLEREEVLKKREEEVSEQALALGNKMQALRDIVS